MSNNRLDIILTNQLIKYSRSKIKYLLVNKNIKKANKIFTDPSYKVKEGDFFSVSLPLENKKINKAQKIPLKIIYEDNDILVVDKPVGMVTHPAPGNVKDTLVNALLYYTKKLSSVNEDDRPGIVHRLDKDTSGLIVIAKNNMSYFSLINQFKENKIKKKYSAIVWGVPNNQSIKGYISRHKKNRKKMILNNDNFGKFSETKIKLKKSFKICSLVECELKTGRTHQIRVHMSSINSPIIGDKIYGKKNIIKIKKNEQSSILSVLKKFNRQALHANILGLYQPSTNKYLEFKSDMPKDMLEMLEFLSKY